jgi:NAD(P)-dependent dehydrogenase (short-subunit alcohol dehydrogenase family)
VTSEESVAAVAEQSPDTSIVINNAGIFRADNTLLDRSMEEIRAMFDTNFFGAVQVVKTFAPILKANGGGALLDVHSVLSWEA